MTLLRCRALMRVRKVFDDDVNAFMVATGIPNDGTIYFSATAQEITGSELWDAIEELVLSLKSSSIWGKCIAIYPLIGGTAFTHKWNLKDPRDIDAAFRLIFTGAITHSGTGMLGTPGAADTRVSPYNDLSFTENHLSAYIRTEGTLGYDMGASDNAALTLNEFALLARNAGNAYYSADGGYNCLLANASSKGYFVGTGTTPQKLWKHNLLLKSINSGGGQLAGSGNSATVGILSIIRETGVGVVNSDKETCFNSVGDTLSDADVGNLHTAVQALQVTLNREV